MSSLIRFRSLAPVLLALRNMAARRARTALTGLGIALGVAVVLAVNVTNASLLASFNAVFDEAGGQADLTVIDRARGGRGFDSALAARVAQMPGVVAAAPAVQAITLPADDLSGWQALNGVAGTLAAGNQLLLLGVDPRDDTAVRDFTLVAGRLLDPGERRYSAVLVDEYAADHGYQVGDRFSILHPAGQGVIQLMIVGLVDRSGSGLINGGAVAFLPLPVAQELFDRQGRLDRIDVVADATIADAQDELAALRDRMAAALGNDVRVIYPGTRGEELAKRMTSYRLGLDLFSTVAMFVGGFLIYNTFAMSIAERTRDMGLLRAVGMTRRQILLLVLTEAGLLSIVGSALGLGLGLGMARGMSATVSVVAGSAVTPLSIPPAAFARSLVVGLGVTLVASLWPALRAAGISPLQALKARAQTDAGKWRRFGWRFGPGMLAVGWLLFNDVPLRREVAWPIVNTASIVFLLGAAFAVSLADRPLTRLFRPLAARMFGHEGHLGVANVARAQSRTIVTVATLMIGIGMNIGIVSLGDSFRFELSRWTEAATGGDLIIRSPTRIKRQATQQLATIEGVGVLTAERDVEVWTTGAAIEDEILFVAIQPRTRQQTSHFIFESMWEEASERSFARLDQGDAVFISTTMADRYRLKVGEHISLDTPRGVRTFQVAGIVVDFTGNGLMVYGDWEDLRRYFGVDDADRVILGLAPGYTTPDVRGRIEAQLGARLNLTVEVVEDLMRSTLKIVDQSFVMFDTLALIVVSVSAMGVVNTMAISVIERQREISMLRGVGFTRRQVRRMILSEAATLGVMGGALGLVLGLFLARMYIKVVQHLAGYELAYKISISALVSGLLIALIISQAAALFPAMRAARRPIVAALKEE